MTSIATSSESEKAAYVTVVEETLERISQEKGVVGYLVLNPKNGSLMKFGGFDDNAKCAKHYANKLHGFIDLAASTIRTIDWKDNMTFLRLSHGEYDILVAADVNQEYNLVVVQQII